MAIEIGAVIRDIRKKRGMTQGSLAEATGTTQAYVSNIEKGKVNPSLDILARIAEVFEVPLPVLQFMQLDDELMPDDKKTIFNQVRGPMYELLNDAFNLRATAE